MQVIYEEKKNLFTKLLDSVQLISYHNREWARTTHICFDSDITT